MSGVVVPAVQSCIVEASAGTGKTRELVNEIVRAIRTGVDVDRIVAVTFTHAAAGEMKIRVRQELDRARAEASGDECDRLIRGLQMLDRAFIGTIHSFCAQLLRRRPVEACVDPAFIELSQADALRVFAGVFRRWIEQNLESPSPALHRALARLAWMEDGDIGEPIDALRNAAWRLTEWRDHPSPWEQRPVDREQKLAELTAEDRTVVALRNRCSRSNDFLYLKLQPLADFVGRVESSVAAGAADPDLVESDLLRLPRALRWLPGGRGEYADGLTRDAVGAECNKLVAEIELFRRLVDAELAAAIRDDLWQVVQRYHDAKTRAGQLDFLDLLICARNLLRNDYARPDLQARFDRIYIDEFQDTDPLQAEILLLLAADDPTERDWRKVRPFPGKLFVVGDPKQSIYRFRRADSRIYRTVHDHLLGAGTNKRPLTSSRRSVRPIQQFVNAAFSTSIPNYLPLEGGEPAPANQPSLVALPMPHPFGTRNIAKEAIDRCAPGAVAAFIEWLIESSHWIVREPGTNERVPIRPDHVCVLFRRFTNQGTDLTQEYVRCLEARGIRHVLVGSKSFHQREEVGTIRTALRAIEWLDDELSVFAVLRGSLFSIADGTLLKFRHQFKRFSPLVDLPEELDEEFEPVRDAFQLLRELHRRRNYRAIADTILALIEHTRAHAGFAFRKGGERVLANVYRLTDLARSFEVGGASSFRSFVEYLEQEAASGETTEAPVLEQQAGGVKLMTVHRAKGLEFPVVILADLTARLAGVEGGDRYVDEARGLCAQRLLGWMPWELLDHAAEEAQEDYDEALRVAYVAATRARDLLVVSTVGEVQKDDSWLSPLYDAVYPPQDRWRICDPHPGCPRTGDTTVLNRPLEMRGDTSVRPGLHLPKEGEHEIVWFDPGLLKLSDAKDEGLDRDELLQGTPEQITVGLQHYQSWRDERHAMVEAGSKPRWTVKRIAEIGDVPEAETIPLSTITLDDGSRQRPSGRQFGRLVHAVLQVASRIDQIETIARSHGRKLRCSDEEIEAAITTARAALQHPLLTTCMGLQQFREYPVILRLDDGSIAEGNIDLAYTDGQSWTVIDYKTGPAAHQRYRRQLRLYGLALARATKQPVQCLLFEI